jgi:hypothetical protein
MKCEVEDTCGKNPVVFWRTLNSMPNNCNVKSIHNPGEICNSMEKLSVIPETESFNAKSLKMSVNCS